MHWLSAWFVRNPVAANLLMVLILAAGVLSFRSMRIESFPRIPPRVVSIDVAYPGATAAQVDAAVTQKIEQALEGLPGVRRTFATSGEGYASVQVERTSGYDLERLLQDARGRVDAVVGWPAGAERPLYTRDEFSVFGLIVQISGGGDVETLQRAARIVEDELLSRPEISDIEVFGKRRREIGIEVDDARLEAFGLTLHDVRSAVGGNSLRHRAGVVESGGQRILLRADGEAQLRRDFAELPLLNLPDGRQLRLEDVAHIHDGFEAAFVQASFNGQRSVGIIVNTDREGHLLRIREAVDEVLEAARHRLPAEVKLTLWADSSDYIRDRLELIRSNAMQGLAIILVLLSLFLDLRLALWVAIGIPVSIAGTLAVMGETFLGHSLNDVTTFGLIIVLGIIVDDAIVVGESIHDARRNGLDGRKAAIAGVHRVSTATVFGALTTVAAFFPLLLIDNDIARIFAGFAVVVIAAVLVSLVESKFVLPAHLSHRSIVDADVPPRARVWDRLRAAVDHGLSFVIERAYVPVLKWALRRRIWALTGLAGVLLLPLGLAVSGRVPVVFFPDVPGNTIVATARMDPSSPEALTAVNAARLEEAAREANQQLSTQHDLVAPPLQNLMVVATGPGALEAYGEVTTEAMNRVGSIRVMQAWRDVLGPMEGAVDQSFSASLETGGGFALEVVGDDPAYLAAATESLVTRIASLEGVHDVRSDLIGGQPEIRMHLTPSGRHLGFTTADLAIQVGDGFGGGEIQRMQRGDDEVRVLLRHDEQRRGSLHHALNSRVATADGRRVPLREVAAMESGYAAGTIARRDGRRAATIEASIDKASTGSQQVWNALADDVARVPQRWPGVTVRPAGELTEQGEVQRGMRRALVFIALLIYALLAIPLASYVQPIVIMSVVPFGFAGAVLGHLLMGLPLSILSFFGAMAATGVVVNDSLVLATKCNQLRKAGTPLLEALVAAGRSRFRPIFLTTVTTVAGLLPLIFETSEQAQYLIPAAVSLAAAELLATPVALFLVPIAIGLLHDMSPRRQAT